MICLICRRAEIVERAASVKLQRDEFRLTVSGVPAHICPDCGETYVEEEVAVQLLRNVEEIYAAGIPQEVIEYERLRAP